MLTLLSCRNELLSEPGRLSFTRLASVLEAIKPFGKMCPTAFAAWLPVAWGTIPKNASMGRLQSYLRSYYKMALARRIEYKL